MEPTILHADLDAFYASVEQLIDPSLAGRPVIVGGGIVLAASYEARAHGVTAPMPTRDALRLCPTAVVVEGHYDRYLELSDRVMEVFADTGPIVEQISVDEAFMDVRGSAHLLGAPSAIARRLRERVRCEVGLPLSVGVASTKFLAKVASARAKPNGLVVVPRGSELDFLHPLPVEAMWGVGPVTSRNLRGFGIATIGELAEIPARSLSSVLGPGAGRALHSLSWNRDPRPVRSGRRAGSVGSQQALGRGLTDPGELAVVVMAIADRIGRRLRAKNRVGSTLSLRARFPGPRTVSRSHTLRSPTSATAAISNLGVVLLDRATQDESAPVTLVGMSVSNLTTDAFLQLELGVDEGHVLRSGSEAALRRRALDESVDAVRERFGRSTLRLGIGNAAGVPDGFRELAEKS